MRYFFSLILQYTIIWYLLIELHIYHLVCHTKDKQSKNCNKSSSSNKRTDMENIDYYSHNYPSDRWMSKFSKWPFRIINYK